MYAESQSLRGLGELAQLFGYTRDHLAYLCRTGQISATRTGRNWQTTPKEVERYKSNVNVVQKQRWEEMSKKQRLEEAGPALSYHLAYAMPRPSVFASVLSAGLLSAFDSFRLAVKLICWPTRAVFWTANKAAYLVYHAFNTPLDGLAVSFVSRWKLATVPVHELYPELSDQYSLFGLVKGARRARLAFTSVLSVFIAVNFLFSGANFISGAAGATSAAAAPRTFSAQSRSMLVRDYLQLAQPAAARVAGAKTAIAEAVGTEDNFGNFLVFWRETLDCSRFFCYNINIE